MRLVTNLILLGIVAGLAYLLVDSIREPIKFKSQVEKRKSAVVDRLIQIRKAQDVYRSITGGFAHTFDTLQLVLENGEVPTVKVIGDPDDPTNMDNVTYDTSYEKAMVSIENMGINLDSLRYVPYGVGEEFDIAADTLTYQKTVVNVVEVKTSYNKFMGMYSDPKYARYDNGYDPNAVIKFGNMNAPNTSGNWER